MRQIFYSHIRVKTALSTLETKFYSSPRHPDLLMKKDDTDFVAAESTCVRIGVVLYIIAGILGYAITPSVALVIFFILPLFYGLTSHGLDLLLARRRA